jgi:uncharacterized membrane protein YhaH (DUF805 family)
MNWYIHVLRKYAVFSGRAQRKEYWMFFLFNFLIAFGIGFISGMLPDVPALGIASSVYTLAVLIPGIAVGVRRMHDIGRSGWWVLLPFVNLVMFCFKGQDGDNEFGPDPKLAFGVTSIS